MNTPLVAVGLLLVVLFGIPFAAVVMGPLVAARRLLRQTVRSPLVGAAS